MIQSVDFMLGNSQRPSFDWGQIENIPGIIGMVRLVFLIAEFGILVTTGVIMTPWSFVLFCSGTWQTLIFSYYKKI